MMMGPMTMMMMIGIIMTMIMILVMMRVFTCASSLTAFSKTARSKSRLLALREFIERQIGPHLVNELFQHIFIFEYQCLCIFVFVKTVFKHLVDRCKPLEPMN